MPANWFIRDKLRALGRAVYDYIFPPRRGLPTEVVNEDEAKNERFKMNLVRWLRISIFIALSLAAALLGYFAYTTFSDAEQDSFKREFSSSAVLIEDNLRAAFQDIERTALEQAAIFTYRFPDESQWPNITFPNYAKVFKAQLNGTNARGMTFSPLIDARTNRKTWEAYAARAYKSLDLPASIRASLASWPPSKGIYDLPFGQDGRKVYSVVPIPGSRYPYLLVPTWQTIPRIYSTFLMFNLHANGPRMLTIGQAVKARKPALSDFLALLIDPVTVIRPSSIMYAPIIGFHDRKKVLGMTSLFFSWDSLLSGSLPSFIDGIECVIMSSSSLTSYTFSISGSNVAIESIGDAHNSKYNHLRNMFSIQIDAAQEFFFSIYPTQTLENKYKTKTPLYCLIIVLSSIGKHYLKHERFFQYYNILW